VKYGAGLVFVIIAFWESRWFWPLRDIAAFLCCTPASNTPLATV
jgi:hypothetical protein